MESIYEDPRFVADTITQDIAWCKPLRDGNPDGKLALGHTRIPVNYRASGKIKCLNCYSLVAWLLHMPSISKSHDNHLTITWYDDVINWKLSDAVLDTRTKSCDVIKSYSNADLSIPWHMIKYSMLIGFWQKWLLTTHQHVLFNHWIFLAPTHKWQWFISFDIR